jgi:hypothetical protein
MKKLLFILSGIVFFILTSCGKPNEKEHYIKEYFIIKEKGGFAERNGKYTNVGKYFLIQRLADTTEFTELNGHNFGQLGEYYGSSLYYNKEEGDTLYFEYILNITLFAFI